MLEKLIRFSLRQRALVVAAALLLLATGAQTLMQLPVEVLPDLTKPTVTILTECPGLAPEEVERRVTRPIESAVQGVAGLDRMRSNSDVSLSLVFVEFAWGTDIYRARQLVQERLQTARELLPENATPGLTPVSSLMGEVLLVGLTSDTMKPPDLRTLADTTVRRRLQSIAGVAEVLAIGGGVQQVHVLPDPQKMAAWGLSAEDVEKAVAGAAGSSTSGYMVTPSREIMVRNLAMTIDPETIGRTPVVTRGDAVVLLKDVARVEYGVETMRGDASVNGRAGVILSVDKAPGFDTVDLTAKIEQALKELEPALPAGVDKPKILFRQADFIGYAVGNLKDAIIEGAVMVTIVLLLFLLSLRTTLITLTAIPLSFAVTLLVFRWFDISVNSMTLGGLAVAIGMVVDDAIVDVENVWRRLRENAGSAAPKPALEVIATASGEVRSSILYATLLIILVFVPLLGLQGLDGRLFQPIAIATMTSMAASFVVSLTVIPVLCSLLLKPSKDKEHRDSWLVRVMKNFVSLTFLKAARIAPLPVLGVTGMLMIGAGFIWKKLGTEFLPTFNEGSATISLAGPPGSSLEHTNQVGEAAVKILQSIPEVKSVGRRAGRAERDDHVMPVSVNEFDVEFTGSGRPRLEVFADIRKQLGTIKGTFVNVGQPISHRLSHMLSGVSAKIAVKIFGPDLDTLRSLGREVEQAARDIPGLTDVLLEPQVPIPQLRIEPDRDRARAYGLQPETLSRQVSALLGGRTLAELTEGERKLDLVMRLPPELRNSPEKIAALPVPLPDGRRIPLSAVASVHEASGPNVINRENTQRRVIVSANSSTSDLGSLVDQWKAAVAAKIKLPEGCSIQFEGEYQAREKAAKRIAIFSAGVLVIVFVLLHALFRSSWLAVQVLLNIPLALIGGLAFAWWKLSTISIATMVGFIAVAGVAARNSIMMLSHYLHLMKHEHEAFTWQMVERGTLERLVPVLMTALSAGIALVPLVLSPHAPGKEILHPVAVVITGGLISSTLLDLVVTPAVFYHFGRRAAEKALRADAPAAH